MGIIRGVHQSHSEQEILEHIESSVPIINVQRFHRRFDEGDTCKYIPTQTVKITFQAKYMPEAVYFYHTRFITEKYIFPVQQCRKCQKF